MNRIMTTIKDAAIGKAKKTILSPIDTMIDENITDITTTIGSFIIRKIRGKFQRSISFSTGSYSNDWMEEALYGILYQWNNIKKSSRLEITNKRGMGKGAGMYYRLDDGTHSLKYKNYDILLVIQTIKDLAVGVPSRGIPKKVYTIITYDLSPEFVKDFERDMVIHRNALLQIKSDSPIVNVYQDYHESDGYTYWERKQSINKRRIGTVYLPRNQMKEIVDTVNEFFTNKEYYIKHGITHNLKILLYGPVGTGKDSIAKMIASEWNRNIYYVSGGKEGRYIPHAIVDDDDCVNHSLFIISDIDKYPFIINEPDIDMSKDGAKEEMMRYKGLYGEMINALDGILSGEDRIIVMTTNHIEKFGEAFLRPGRINLKMEIGHVVPEVFRKYVFDFYGKVLPEDIKLKRNDIIIAEMQKDVLFMKLTADEFIKKYVK